MTPIEPIKLLFVCRRNSCRSPMAAGFARHWGGPSIVASSAGLEPKRRSDPLAAHVMAARGVDLRSHRGRVLRERDLRAAHRVLLLCGHDEDLGALPRGSFERWEVEDPLGWPLDIYADVRDEIERRVKQLLRELPRSHEPAWEPARQPWSAGSAAAVA